MRGLIDRVAAWWRKPQPALLDEMLATVAAVKRLNALVQAGACSPTRAQRLLFAAYCEAVGRVDYRADPRAAMRLMDGLRTLTYQMAPMGEGN
jgi:hypothetical protein